MKIALITDTHWGCRNDDVKFSDFFCKFYREAFFPYLDKHDIKTIVHLGDIVDRRKYINFTTANKLRNNFIQPCKDRGIDLHMIIGNHDTFYKNTNKINSMQELYSSGDFKCYPDPAEVVIGDTQFLFLPWICDDNYAQSMELITKTKAQICFGHLELSGFEMYKGSVIDHGMNKDVFSKFEIVCSGHYHHKSTKGNINYLGAPYEITWSDYGDPRGFHVFDTDTRELTFVANPYVMFFKIHYDDVDKSLEDVIFDDFSLYEKTIVKIIVRNKTNPYWFDMFVEKLEKAGVYDIQVVDDHFNLNLENDQDIIDEAEDTLTILSKYVGQMQLKTDKPKLENLLRSLYSEALTME